jgi:hypothetical protein
VRHCKVVWFSFLFVDVCFFIVFVSSTIVPQMGDGGLAFENPIPSQRQVCLWRGKGNVRYRARKTRLAGGLRVRAGEENDKRNPKPGLDKLRKGNEVDEDE